jgi:hypothetical protein
MKMRLLVLVPLAVAAIAAASREVKFSYAPNGHGYLKSLLEAPKAKGADGTDAIAVLAQTKPGLPDYWK